MKKNEESQKLTSLQAGEGFQGARVSMKEVQTERLHSAVRESLRHSLAGETRFESAFKSQTQTVTETVYNDLLSLPLQQKEPMVLLRSNIETLENMIQRWSFVMKENRYLLKADSDEFT